MSIEYRNPNLRRDQTNGSYTWGKLAKPVSSKTGLPLLNPYEIPQERRFSYRNPNSPSAIQARLNNQPNPDKFAYRRILKPTDFYIDIKPTRSAQSEIYQRHNYTALGGTFGSKSFVGIATKKDPETGETMIRSYYFDSLNLNWRKLGGRTEKQVPNTPGTFYSGSPEIMWRNYKKDADGLTSDFRLTSSSKTIDSRRNKPPKDQYYDSQFGPMF